MNLIQCRFNPNHKMKPSRRELHESKCPDRFKSTKKTCPYNPTHIVEENEYESHKITCENRPKMTIQQYQKEQKNTLDDKVSERDQILYIREKYYKNCVIEKNIIGLGKRKNKKKKKIIQHISKIMEENEKKNNENQLIFIDEEENKIDNQNVHYLEDLESDKNFKLENDDISLKYNPNAEDEGIGKLSYNVVNETKIKEILE